MKKKLEMSSKLGEQQIQAEASKIMQRLQRRLLIRETLARKFFIWKIQHKLSYIKKTVRQKETPKEIKALIKQLATHEFIVDPEIDTLFQKIAVYFRYRYPLLDISFVLFGSNVHGGALVRKVFDTTTKADVDCGVIITPHYQELIQQKKISPTIFEDIRAELAHLLGKKRIKLCDSFNPSTLHWTHFVSVEDTIKMLIDKINSGEIANNLFFSPIVYLFPTYPNNHTDANILISSLKQMAIENETHYRIISAFLSFLWENSHEIKQKHIETAYKKSSTGIYPKLTDYQLSTQLMDLFSSILDNKLDQLIKKK